MEMDRHQPAPACSRVRRAARAIIWRRMQSRRFCQSRSSICAIAELPRRARGRSRGRIVCFALGCRCWTRARSRALNSLEPPWLAFAWRWTERSRADRLLAAFRHLCVAVCSDSHGGAGHSVDLCCARSITRCASVTAVGARRRWRMFLLPTQQGSRQIRMKF